MFRIVSFCSRFLSYYALGHIIVTAVILVMSTPFFPSMFLSTSVLACCPGRMRLQTIKSLSYSQCLPDVNQAHESKRGSAAGIWTQCLQNVAGSSSRPWL